MNLFDKDTTSTNENAFINLEAGKHPYRIVSAKTVSKDNVLIGIQVSFRHLHTGKPHNHFYAVAAEGDRGRLAKGDMKALWEAMRLGGDPGLDRLPNFTDKVVEIEAIHTTPDTNGRIFANIRGTWPYEGNTLPTKPAETFTSPDDSIDPQDNPMAETPAPAPAASTSAAPEVPKPRKWAGAKK